MKLLWLLALVFAVAPSVCLAQVSGPSSLTSSISPTLAAELALAEQANFKSSSAPLSVGPEAPQPPRQAWMKARRSHWLLGTGIGIMAGSALAGLLAGRSRYCEYHEYEIDKRPPRVAAAVVGTVGLTLTVVGALRFQGWPNGEPMLTRRRQRQRLAIGFASLGLGLMSIGIVSAAALPEMVTCGTT